MSETTPITVTDAEQFRRMNPRHTGPIKPKWMREVTSQIYAAIDEVMVACGYAEGLSPILEADRLIEPDKASPAFIDAGADMMRRGELIAGSVILRLGCFLALSQLMMPYEDLLEECCTAHDVEMYLALEHAPSNVISQFQLDELLDYQREIFACENQAGAKVDAHDGEDLDDWFDGVEVTDADPEEDQPSSGQSDESTTA